MFNVKEKITREKCTVYDVKEKGSTLYFLVYSCSKWCWEEANGFEPYNEFEGVGY